MGPVIENSTKDDNRFYNIWQSLNPADVIVIMTAKCVPTIK